MEYREEQMSAHWLFKL